MEDSALTAKQQPDVLVEAQPTLLTSIECHKYMLTSISSTVTEQWVVVAEMHPYQFER